MNNFIKYLDDSVAELKRIDAMKPEDMLGKEELEEEDTLMSGYETMKYRESIKENHVHVWVEEKEIRGKLFTCKCEAARFEPNRFLTV